MGGSVPCLLVSCVLIAATATVGMLMEANDFQWSGPCKFSACDVGWSLDGEGKILMGTSMSLPSCEDACAQFKVLFACYSTEH